MAKSKTILVTPIGTLNYPWLDKPDTKFSDDGVYKTDINVPEADAQDLINKIEEMITAKGQEMQSSGVKTKRCKHPVYTKNDDGTVTFRCKVDAITRLRNGDVWDRKPVFIDASRKQIEALSLRGGSICRLALELYAWYNPSQGVGIKLQPLKVQVLEPVLGSAAESDEFADMEYEGGFVGDEVTASAQSTSSSPVADDDSEDW